MFVSGTMETDPIVSHEVMSDMAVVTAGYLVYDDNDVEDGVDRPNGLADYQLLYIKKGVGHFLLGGKKMDLPAGTAVIFHPFEQQKYHYLKKEKSELYWIHIGGRVFDEFLTELGLNEKRIFKIHNDSVIVESIYNAVDELLVKKAGYQQAALAHSIQAFVSVSRNESSKPQKGLLSTIELALIKIRREYATDASNADYAAEFNISVSYFLHLFKKSTGTTPKKYKLQLRIDAAKHMLVNTNYKITNIAHNVGFNDSQYFCKYFHRVVGLSPSDFRRQYKLR